MINYIKNILMTCKNKFQEDAAKSINDKIIKCIFGAGGALALTAIAFVNNKFIHPPFSGEITAVSYEPCLMGQKLGKTFDGTEKGIFYYYEGDIQVTLQGKGNIKKAYFVYNDKDQEITSGDVYIADIEKESDKFEVNHTMYMRSDNCEAKIPIYLIIIDKKTSEKNIYCLVLDLESMNTSSIIEIEEGSTEDTFNASYSINPYADKMDIRCEIFTKEDIQKLEKNFVNSYASFHKQEILMDFEKLENFNLQ